ncbi:MAG: 30S ribosomal protein S3 [Candidatus Improbicoccus devescovinae]|nr:MAG: 30S ribosomal protein S3 [Candidatus Improbicoccus devescovinae]
MGQKVNPHGLRVGINKNWNSRWFVKRSEFAKCLIEDNVLRRELKAKLYTAGVSKIEIERDSSKIKIFVFCAKPGIIIGRAGSGIEKIRVFCEKVTKNKVSINVVEIKKPDSNAQLVSESVAQQLEKRISFRRAVKQSITRAMKSGVKGIKLQVGGRLGGAEIARSERYHEGSIPLQTLRADIDYGFAEAFTTYGMIGVKTWIYKGEILKCGVRAPGSQKEVEANANADSKKD